MPFNLAFYIHHHGAGHLMRSLTIAKALPEANITFFGSAISKYKLDLPEHIRIIELPIDIPSAEDEAFYNSKDQPSYLHYAPINVEGIRMRNVKLVQFFCNCYPLMLFVDVSVEITALARLCGIPTVVVRQHGDRRDYAHEQAYRSAEMLLAPYPDFMTDSNEAEWVRDKTFYSGGFSKYTGLPQHTGLILPHSVLVLVGNGGTSINMQFLSFLALEVADWQIHVIGTIAGVEKSVELPSNLTLHGEIAEPLFWIDRCEVIIGNAGHNTVMEIADRRKPLILIPEDRPFDEQLVKCMLLSNLRLALVVANQRLYESNWAALLDEACGFQTKRWDGTISQDAPLLISQEVKKLYTEIYCPTIDLP